MHTNDPTLKSFIATTRESHFPIQNLPFGIFSNVEDPTPRVGVAIGDQVLDLAVLADADLLPEPSEIFRSGSLNQFVALGHATWRATRDTVSQLLRHDNPLLRDK